MALIVIGVGNRLSLYSPVAAGIVMPPSRVVADDTAEVRPHLLAGLVG